MRDKGFVASVKEAWVSMTGFSRAIWSFIAVIASWKAAQAALTFALACKAWIPVVIANPAGTAIYTIQTLLSKPLVRVWVLSGCPALNSQRCPVLRWAYACDTRRACHM